MGMNIYLNTNPEMDVMVNRKQVTSRKHRDICEIEMGSVVQLTEFFLLKVVHNGKLCARNVLVGYTTEESYLSNTSCTVVARLKSSDSKDCVGNFTHRE